MLAGCPAERVYVTAFLAKADFRKYAADIAWETEVWIAETPDHMIHFNGPKFWDCTSVATTMHQNRAPGRGNEPEPSRIIHSHTLDRGRN